MQRAIYFYRTWLRIQGQTSGNAGGASELTAAVNTPCHFGNQHFFAEAINETPGSPEATYSEHTASYFYRTWIHIQGQPAKNAGGISKFIAAISAPCYFSNIAAKQSGSSKRSNSCTGQQQQQRHQQEHRQRQQQRQSSGKSSGSGCAKHNSESVAGSMLLGQSTARRT